MLSPIMPEIEKPTDMMGFLVRLFHGYYPYPRNRIANVNIRVQIYRPGQMIGDTPQHLF